MKKAKKFNYERWQYTKSLEQFFGVSNMDTKQFFELLERDIFGKGIQEIIKRVIYYEPKKDKFSKSIKNTAKQSNYYEIYLEDGERYNIVFENACKGGCYYVILLYEEYYTSYEYRKRSIRLELSYEVFNYRMSLNGTVMFHCHYNDYHKQFCICTYTYSWVELSFMTMEDTSVVELVCDGDYYCVLDAISKYKENECDINDLFEVYNVILKKITSKVHSFVVKVKLDYSLTYLNGELKAMRTMVDGHYVICDTYEQTVWQNSLTHYENFKYVDGKVYNGKMKEVTDAELASKIISNITEGEKLFESFHKMLSSN